jgi:predicted secreted protein
MMREIMLSIISSYISRVKRKKDETQMSKASSMMFKEKKTTVFIVPDFYWIRQKREDG